MAIVGIEKAGALFKLKLNNEGVRVLVEVCDQMLDFYFYGLQDFVRCEQHGLLHVAKGIEGYRLWDYQRVEWMKILYAAAGGGIDPDCIGVGKYGKCDDKTRELIDKMPRMTSAGSFSFAPMVWTMPIDDVCSLVNFALKPYLGICIGDYQPLVAAVHALYPRYWEHMEEYPNYGWENEIRYAEGGQRAAWHSPPSPVLLIRHQRPWFSAAWEMYQIIKGMHWRFSTSLPQPDEDLEMETVVI